MRILLSLLTLAAALAASLPAQDIRDPLTPSEGFYSVQIGARASTPEAEALVASAEALGALDRVLFATGSARMSLNGS